MAFLLTNSLGISGDRQIDAAAVLLCKGQRRLACMRCPCARSPPVTYEFSTPPQLARLRLSTYGHAFRNGAFSSLLVLTWPVRNVQGCVFMMPAVLCISISNYDRAVQRPLADDSRNSGSRLWILLLTTIALGRPLCMTYVDI